MTVELVAEVFANWGRWKAKCPRPDCPGAEEYGHHISDYTGLYGGLDEQALRCTWCGLAVPVVWPEPSMRSQIEQLLADRPMPQNRNWLPGETLHDLFAENMAHGCLPAEPDRIADGGVPALTIYGPAGTPGQITDGRRASVPGFGPRRSLEG